MFNQLDESTTKLTLVNATNSVAELISGEFSEKIHRIWGSDLMEYLTASDYRRHVWCAWLSRKTEHQPNPSLSDFLRFTKSRDIIMDGFGSCPPGFLPILRKLGTSAEQADFYLSLFELFSKGGRATKLIQHGTNLDRDIVSNLLEVPDDEFSVQVLSHLIQKSVEHDRFSGAVWVAGMLKEAIGETTVINALRQSSNPLKALRQMLVTLEFPPAPFHFDGPLIPVASSHELRLLGHEFRNCLRDPDELVDIAFGIQAGRHFLYRWNGTEPGVVQLSKFGTSGWLIEDAKGLGNAKLSRDTQHQILDLFAQYPAICPAWPRRQALPSYVWFYNQD